MNLPIRVAVVGGRRGATFAHSAQSLADKVTLAAVCDTNEKVLEPWRTQGVRCYNDYAKLLEDDAIDAVCLATPMRLHARQALEAMAAGKHVLSEVAAACTMEECWDLVRAVERGSLTYMMAENCCFWRDAMMVGEMVRRGVFGELISAEGDYLHDCRELLLDADGTINWRGESRRDDFCNDYPTHSLGPVCKWLGINETDGLATTATWNSGSFATAAYMRRNLGAEHALCEPTQWRLPDHVVTLIRTRRGVLVKHCLDHSSPRPGAVPEIAGAAPTVARRSHSTNRYALQGTHAAFTSNITPDLEPLIWIEDRSPTKANGIAEEWEPLYTYADEFEHPLWRQYGHEAIKAGHRGGDYFLLMEFADAIIEGRPPLIDVYDAVTWSSIMPLSAISLQNNNMSVEVPNFKSGYDHPGSP